MVKTFPQEAGLVRGEQKLTDIYSQSIISEGKKKKKTKPGYTDSEKGGIYLV